MGSDTLPKRVYDSNIVQDYYNVIERALIGDIFCRNVNGISQDAFGSLGSASNRWFSLFCMSLRILGDAGHYAGLTPDSGMSSDYTLTLPQQLPVSTNSLAIIDNSGHLILIDPDSSLDSTGAAFSVNSRGVTKNKFTALGQQISANCGIQSITSTSFVGITNQSVTLTTHGRPVYIAFAVNSFNDNVSITCSSSQVSRIRFLRDGTEISRQSFNITRMPVSCISHIDVPSAGTHTYTAEADVISSSIAFNSMKLTAFEYF